MLKKTARLTRMLAYHIQCLVQYANVENDVFAISCITVHFMSNLRVVCRSTRNTLLEPPLFHNIFSHSHSILH